MEVKKNEIVRDTENSKEFSREEKDDEISIDLGKITGFFKKKEEGKKTEVQDKPEKAEETKQGPEPEAKHQSESQVPETKTSEDDEISLDFSKIKNIFKKKESTKYTPTEEKTSEEDDEISVDFSKLKNIKNIFKKSDEIKDSDEDISIDYKKISNFFVKYRVLLLLLIPIILSVSLRVQPAYLPITDEWASNSVINNLRSQISSQINQQYPNLPSENKNVLIENELNKVLKEQNSQIDQQITGTSNFFKSQIQDDTGQTYLLAIDPYFWMRHARNIIEKGNPGDEIKNGVPWDNHMLAPIGRGVPPDMFHAYFEAYLYKFFSLFNNNLNLMKVAFFIPVLISALAIIPAFFISRKIAGNFGGFIAATIVAIHPSFLTRTVGGFSDTDAYNVMFPLFIAWLFLEALEAKDIKKTAILSVISGLLVSLYSLTWGGWWYIFDFILVSTVFYIAYYAFVHKKDLAEPAKFVKQKAIKNSITFLLIFFIISALSITILINFNYFATFSNNPLGFARMKEVAITTIWPNVFTTVAEQNPASLNNVINQVGLGKFFFFLIALMGITLTITRKEHKKIWFIVGALGWYLIIFFLKDNPLIQNLNTFLILISIPIIIRIIIALKESDTEIDIKYAIFLVLWFIATTYASTKGIRFTLLLVPAFAIGFGIALGEFYKYASNWITRGLQVNKYISRATIIIVLLLLLIAPYRSAASTGKNEIPSFNDAWATSLERIKEDSEANAIINSWWDFGHWFKFWADRAVTFDGTSQNSPQAHWIGKVLLTDDEELSIGILRMLDCNGVNNFDIIANLVGDGAKAIDILYEIMPENKENAKKILSEKFSDDDTEKILEFTHCQPPENYFITSEDMIGKSGVWAHFGSWDFDRALIYNTLKKKEYGNNLDKSIEFIQERYNYSEEDAENLFYEIQNIKSSSDANNWIAPWPGYAGTVGCSRNEDTLTCDNGFLVNLTSKGAFAQSDQGILHPQAISFPTNEGLIVKEYNESLITLQNNRNLGLALIKEGDSYQMLQMDSDLTASMFTRLFYQEGIGLRYFKKFSDETSVFGERIIIWKVDWEGKEKNIIEINEPENEEEIKEIEIEINETETNNTLPEQTENKTDIEDIINGSNASEANVS